MQRYFFIAQLQPYNKAIKKKFEIKLKKVFAIKRIVLFLPSHLRDINAMFFKTMTAKVAQG